MTKREEVIQFINNELNIETHELRMGERVLSSPEEALVDTNDVGTSQWLQSDKEVLISLINQEFDDDMININGDIRVQALFWYAHPRTTEVT